jgi:hypothetical protein
MGGQMRYVTADNRDFLLAKVREGGHFASVWWEPRWKALSEAISGHSSRTRFQQ